MSLQVWLPLNGTLENKGLDDIEFTNTTVSGYEDGKIGKALKTLGTNIAFTAPSIEGITQFSVAFWFKSKTNSSITTNWNNVIAINSSNADESTTAEWRFESSYANKYILSAHNNVGDPIMTGTGGLVSERDRWYHVAATCDGASFVKFYIDGEHINSDKTYLGGHLRSLVKIANESADPDALLNDLRIYDHCLSQKEVKELSKGLVGHWPLNDAIGGENLVPNQGMYTSENPYILQTNRTDGYAWVTNSAFEVEPSTQYTFSVYSDGTISNTHGKGSIDISDKPFTTGFYTSIDGTTKNWQSGQYDYARNFTSSYSTFRQEGNRYIWTYTTAANEKYISLRLNGYSDGSTTIQIKFWNFKVEKGSVATPWIPAPSDALYSKMGLDEGIVYDTSGYERNGIISGNVSVSSESKRYSVCTKFDDNSSHISVTDLPPMDIYTIAFLGEYTTNGSSRMAFGFSNGNKLNLYDVQSSNTFFLNTGDGSNNPFKTPSGSNVNSSSYRGDLHHYTITSDGTTVILYIDGENVGTAKTYKAITGTTLYFNGWDSSTSYKCNGRLSDFRIYSTCLDAESVKELYETSASVDKNGNWHCYELSEL